MEAFQLSDSAKGPSLFLLEPWMKHEGLTAGFTGRLGGTSAVPWQSLNCGLHVGDERDAVVANRELLAQAIGWPFEAWTCGEQVHGCAVHQVTAVDRGSGRDSLGSAIPATDALITDEEDVLLVSFYADCVPLYFYDPVRKAVALAHAGWKGTVLEIAARTVREMEKAYGSRPEHLLAAIGPAIGACCYEVDEAVLSKVEPLVGGLEPRKGGRTLREAVVKPAGEGKAFLNLKELNRHIMIKAGILPIRIEMSQWCTGCSGELFFSHRKEGGATGRMASWIGMRSVERK